MILPHATHIPVLLPEVLAGLDVKEGKKYIDATIGGGGHTGEIVKRGGVVLGIDTDSEAITYLKQKFKDKKQVVLRQGNFANLESIAEKEGFKDISGILFDLGMSTHQLKESGRGFTFERDEPLDMRMDTGQKMNGADVIHTFSAEELYEIFTKCAEELHSRAIAEAIVRTRTLEGAITRTSQLVRIIDSLLPDLYRGSDQNAFFKIRIQTLARIFQAIRITVNDELKNLEKGLCQGINLLGKEGRLVVLSYHSLEDRLVKLLIKEEVRKGTLQRITKKPVTAKREEIALNPKSRSAKLRIAQKL